MRYQLADFQSEAVEKLISRIKTSQAAFQNGDEYSAVVLNAITGAGKTVIATAVIEQLLFGGDFTDPVDGTTILWVTDDPSLNLQTRDKMQAASEKLWDFRIIGQGHRINQETFDPGTIYFLNIQAAGSKTVISNRSDDQRFTIWDTIANTIRARGARFLVIVDEAHRGVDEKANKENLTIINKIINGNLPVPVFVGITATTDKLDKALEQEVAGQVRSVKRHTVPISAVQASGLIKDRIVLHNPNDEHTGLEADTTLIRAGVQRTLQFEKDWADYADSQGHETTVKPALVIQLPNDPSMDQLREVVDAVVEEWPNLTLRGIVNTFAEHNNLDLGNGRVVPYMEPHLIHDATDVRVILAKNAVTTGWDCPRAEVLVSLRTVKDYTNIAQLIGRTVRQPMARRIDTNETLNNVYCLLPNFDSEGVSRVVAQFETGSDGGGGISATRATVTGLPNPTRLDALNLFATMPSYVVPNQSPTPQTKRLHALAAELAGDEIYPEAVAEARRLLNIKLDAEAAKIGPELDARRAKVATVSIDVTTVNVDGSGVSQDTIRFSAKLDRNNVDDVFSKASRRLRDGTAESYWNYLVDKDEDAVVEHKITVAALGMDDEVVDAVQKEAADISSSWLKKYGKAITDLSDARRASYERIQAQAYSPEPTAIIVPQAIEEAVAIDGDTKLTSDGILEKIRSDHARRFTDHLFVDDTDGLYWAKLNPLEASIVDSELKATAVAWYRNPADGRRSLTIPYQKSGTGKWASLHPDFIFFHDVAGALKPSIVDPHSVHLEDSADKLRGLIAYSAKHAEVFRSINAVSEIDGEAVTLAVHDKSTREKVLAALDDGDSVERIYRGLGLTYTP